MSAGEPFEGRFIRLITIDGATPTLPRQPIDPGHPAFPATQTYYTLTTFWTDVEQLLGRPLDIEPVTVAFTETFDRGPEALPLSLEPDIDYATSTLRFSRRLHPSGMVPLSVLLHEATHLLITRLIAPLPQRPWLAEALCDYLAAAHLGDPVIRLIEGCPALDRSLDGALCYPDDVRATSDWLDHFRRRLTGSELAQTQPDSSWRLIASCAGWRPAPAPMSRSRTVSD